MQILFNHLKCLIDSFFGCYKNTGGINAIGIELLQHPEINRIYSLNLIYFISPENNPQNEIRIGKKNINSIALYPEVASVKLYFVA